MTSIILRTSKTLSDYWFSPMPPARLGLVRWCIGLFALWYFSRRIDLYAGVARGDSLHFEPIGLAAFLTSPIPPYIIDGLFAAMLLLILCFTVGWKYRVTAPLLALLSLFLISYRNSWSMIYHTDNAMWLQMFVLAMAPAADRLSVDSWLRKRRNLPVLKDRDIQALADMPSDRYGWPLRLMAIATGVAYFLSGFAKVAGESGWGWALGEPMRMQVAVDGLRKELFGSEAPAMAYFLYEYVWLFTLAGIGTLVLELGAPFFVMHRSIGRLWAFATYGMHMGIWFVMGITFEYCLTGVVFAFLFDLEKPFGYLLSRRFFFKHERLTTFAQT